MFREVRRVLADDGTCWIVIGDSYSQSGGGGYESQGTKQITNRGAQARKQISAKTIGLKPKDLIGIPWLLAFALRADGWYLRAENIWHNVNKMPESVTDRTTRAHEQVFMFTKSSQYFYDQHAVREPHSRSWWYETVNQSGKIVPTRDRGDGGNRQGNGDPSGRNMRSVWMIPTQPYHGEHFAPYPERLVERCIKAGSSERGRCPKCLKPWVRQTRTKKIKRKRPNDLTKRKRQSGTGNACPNTVAGVEVEQLGWAPTCSCGKKPDPDVVIDPFLGSGTTIQVAVRLGRKGIGIELNPQYVKLAKQRIAPSVEKQDVGLVQSLLKQREPVKGLFDAESDVPFEPGRFT